MTEWHEAAWSRGRHTSQWTRSWPWFPEATALGPYVPSAEVEGGDREVGNLPPHQADEHSYPFRVAQNTTMSLSRMEVDR